MTVQLTGVVGPGTGHQNQAGLGKVTEKITLKAYWYKFKTVSIEIKKGRLF
jgi:hypothetical protein